VATKRPLFQVARQQIVDPKTETDMKTLIASAAMLTTFIVSPVAADTWTWVAISNGNTLNAHLARCNLARPNQMLVFDMIADLQENMIADDPHS
jgi:hypothetical protein